MATFILENEPQDNPTVKWSLDIDDDGDVNLLANKQRVLFIDAERGELHRYVSLGTSQVPGLQYEKNAIKVAE